MGLAYAGIDFQVREVDLKHKPQAMLDISPKATVPVLLISDRVVLEESLDILLWSLSENDPDGWRDYSADLLVQMAELIDENDNVFKEHLDHYKYSDRFPDGTRQSYRGQGEEFLEKLDSRLSGSPFLFGEKISYADVGIFSFIRQFSNVEPSWFLSAPYPYLRIWLSSFLESELFQTVMKKYKPWQSGDANLHF